MDIKRFILELNHSCPDSPVLHHYSAEHVLDNSNEEEKIKEESISGFPIVN